MNQHTSSQSQLEGIGELLSELIISFVLPLDLLLQHTLLPVLQECVSAVFF